MSAKLVVDSCCANGPDLLTDKELDIKMISAQHSNNKGENWQKLSCQKILLALSCFE